VSRVRNIIPKKIIGQKELLNLLKFGALLSVAVVAPNALQILQPLFQDERKRYEYYPFSVSKSVTRLWRKGFVGVKESKDGYEVKLTDKGKEEILKFDLNNLEIRTPKNWDGKWRMVFFDISNKRKKARDFLCRKLKSMNFYMMQKSVFVYPFPCDKEIKFVREVIGVPHEVKLGILEKIENEEELKRIFYPLLYKANFR